MKKLICYPFLLLIVTLSCCYGCSNTTNEIEIAEGEKLVYNIPLGGNAYSSDPFANPNTITQKGIENWTNPNEIITVYFRVAAKGSFELSIPSQFVKAFGKSTLEFKCNGIAKRIVIDESQSGNLVVGNWQINQAGYVAISIQGIEKSKTTFPALSHLRLTTSLTQDQMAFVQDKGANYFYWSKRGPYLTLWYPIATDKKYEWFYNEVRVPKNNDVIGSYFATSGCREGYFGMQVNSNVERRILFSIWSPFVTDNPQDIPESKRVKLLRKGEGVTVGEFGNEGSGGQSYWKFNWKPDTTYKFLFRVSPQSDNTTIYTGYFFAPEINQWKLIASFSRPETQTYIKNPYSFLENFMPEQGYLSREVEYGNQWFCDEKGNWEEHTKAQFSSQDIGNVGNIADRLDLDGGVKNQSFFLKHCGFFDVNSKIEPVFNRPISGNKPMIDFSQLP